MTAILNALRERMVFAPGMGFGLDLALSRRGGGGGSPPSASALTIEDGTTPLTLEDGTTELTLEG